MIENAKARFFLSDERGAALIPTILIAGLLVLLVTSMAVFTSNNATSLVILKHQIERDSLLESALNFGMGRVLSTPTGIAVEGSDRIRLQSGEAKLEWRNESARLNLNFADKDFLAGLIRDQGLDDGRAKALADLITVRRNLDMKKPIPKDNQIFNNRPVGPYHHIRDLLDVPGLTPDLFRKLSPYLTVYGNMAAIDPRLADEGLLRALPETSMLQIRDLKSLRGLNAEDAKSKVQSETQLRRYFTFERGPITRFQIALKPASASAELWDIVCIHFEDDDKPFRILSMTKLQMPANR